MMHTWFAKGAVLLANAAIIVIRSPHGTRSREVAVVESRRSGLELALLALVWLGFFVPMLWIVTPWLGFADYPLHPLPFGTGAVCYLVGIWLFQRSHADLGRNWSITLEMREQHRLVTDGVYRRVRHPMYTSIFLFALGQVLVLPNWVAGPVYGLAFTLLYALRVGKEERMMLEHFGDHYRDYAARTKRLVPGIW